MGMKGEAIKVNVASASDSATAAAQEVPPGYKRTEVGVIPEDWRVFPLRRYVLSHNSGVYKKSILYGKGQNIIGVSNLYGIDSIDGQHFSEVPLSREEQSKHTLNEGELLYGESSLVREGIARTVYVTGRGAGTAFAWHTRRYAINQSKLLPDYLYYFLLSRLARKHMMDQSIQTAITGINTVAYFECPILIPPPAEQIAIAAALSDVDGLLGALEALLAKKRAIKQGAMQQLLTGNTRLPGFSGEWEVMRLGEVCGRTTTGKLDANAMVADGDYPFFTCAKEKCWIDKYAFDYEALLVSGNGANVGYVHYYKGKFNAYQRTYVISEFSVDVQFLKHFLERNLRERIRVEVNAGNTPYITMGTLTEMEIVLPRIKDEQRAIATVLSEMDAEIVALEARRDKTRLLKQGMMQQLLTGRIRLI